MDTSGVTAILHSDLLLSAKMCTFVHSYLNWNLQQETKVTKRAEFQARNLALIFLCSKKRFIGQQYFRFQATLLHLGEQYWLSRVLARKTSPQTLHLRLISNPIAGIFSTFKYALVCIGRNKSHIIYFFVVLQMCCK